MLFTKYNVEDVLEVRGQEKYEEGLNAGLTAGRSAGIEEGRIKMLIEDCRDFQISREDTKKRLVSKLSITEDAAEEVLQKYWQ